MATGNAMFGSTASGIPLSHLDYSYIGKCTNTAELEKIIKVLRSGAEGSYPELTLFAEKQLESFNPKSKLLRKEIHIQSYRDLDHEEREQISHEFKDWISEINEKDILLKKDHELIPHSIDYFPPIRSAKTVGSTTSGSAQISNDIMGLKTKGKETAAIPREYQEWDKFNADEELKAQEEKEKMELKSKQEKAKINTKVAELPSDVETSGKTDAELVVLADREKDKGNEAFRCEDYKESLVYYSRSINYKPTAASHNNRAFANLKLEKYREAIEDCNVVISMEPNNIKALLRRTLAYKSNGETDSARHDLTKVLEIEPNNKRAKELLSELNETAIAEDEKPANPQVNGETQTKKKGKRLKIVEVENDEEQAVTEEKKIETSVDGNVVSSHESTGSEFNSVSTTVDEESPGDIENSLGSTSEINAEAPLRTENDKEQVWPSCSSAKSNEAQTSGTVDEKEPPEVTTSPSVSTPPPTPPVVVELPGIVLRAKDEATSLFKLGRYAEAAEKFTSAIEVIEKDKTQFKSALSSLLNNRAACLHRMGDASGCIKDCTASLELIPDSVKPLLKRAGSNEMLEKYEKSYLDFNSVVFLDPNNKNAMEGKSRVSKHLINIYGSSWREKLAGVKVSSIQTSSELLNTDSSATEKPFHILQDNQPKRPDSVASTPPTNTTKKEEPITKTTAPETFEQCKEKGNMFVKKGKLEEAVHCYTQCIELDPSKVAVYTNRALCYLRMEKYNLAEEDASKALDLQEDNVKALYRCALARKALQKYEEAAKDLVNLIKIEPSNSAGKKELDIVLNLCREQRKAKQKAASNSQVNASEVKTSEKQNDSKVETSKKTRRRVQIEEVNGEEDSTQVPSSPSTDPKKPPDSSPKVKKNDIKPQDSSKNTKEGAKVKTSPSKDYKKKNVKLHKASAFDFYQAWNSVKQKDLSSYADILRQLKPAMLPKVLSNKLDADILRCIIGAITEHLFPNGEEKFSFEILQHMCKAQRFNMVMMFLDSNDTRAIRDVFAKLATTRTKNEFVDIDVFNCTVKKYNL